MKKILLIDDEDAIKDAIEIILKDSYEVVYCQRLACAKDMLLAGEPPIDLIILDLMLDHNESGFEMLDFLKERKISTKVIVLSALNSVNAADEAFCRGASGYVTKPIQARKLLSKVATLLNGS